MQNSEEQQRRNVEVMLMVFHYVSSPGDPDGKPSLATLVDIAMQKFAPDLEGDTAKRDCARGLMTEIVASCLLELTTMQDITRVEEKRFNECIFRPHLQALLSEYLERLDRELDETPAIH